MADHTPQTGLYHSCPHRGYLLNADDLDALHTDRANTAAIVAWNGSGSLAAHVFDSIFADERRSEAANRPAQREDSEPRGRYARRRYAS